MLKDGEVSEKRTNILHGEDFHLKTFLCKLLLANARGKCTQKMHHKQCALRTQTWPRDMLAHVDHTRNYMLADHRVHRDRDEIGGVYLPSQRWSVHCNFVP
jgi:hypothetical protein